MSKKTFISAIFGCFVTISSLFAQTIGNEWINYANTYYKITTAQTGFYKITHSQLPDLQGRNPNNFRMFFRGKEQAIHIHGAADGSFDATDYIEFYGQRNNGTLDSALYQNPNHLVNPYFNFHSDTAAYFITEDAVAGKRIPIIDNTGGGFATIDYVRQNQLKVLSTFAFRGKGPFDETQEDSDFSVAEGFVGDGSISNETFSHYWVLSTTPQLTYTVNGITDVFSAFPDYQLQIRLISGSNEPIQQFEISVSPDNTTFRTLSTETLTTYEYRTYYSAITTADISASGDLYVRIKAISSRGIVAVPWVSVNYNKTTSATTGSSKWFNNETNFNSLIITPNNVNSYKVFDLTDSYNISQIKYTNTGAMLQIPLLTTMKYIAIEDSTNYKSVGGIEKVTFQPLDPSQPNYLIVTHKLFQQDISGYGNPVQKYAEYRSTTQGGGFSTLIVNVDQLYNQFTYGEITPLAIKRFARYMKTGGNPEYLFLIGKGRWYDQIWNRHENYVPTWGMPVSDTWLVNGLTNSDWGPEIAVGRISAVTNNDVKYYLDKVMEYETLGVTDDWRKEVLHLGGGDNEEFAPSLNAFKSIAVGPFLGAHVKTIHKNSISGVQVKPIPDEVNAGKGLITFMGHSSVTTSDLDIGMVSSDILGYRNKGKYTNFIMNGCASGDNYTWDRSFGTDWVLTPDRGAVTFMGHVNFGYVHLLQEYTEGIYRTAFADSLFYGKGIGKIQQQVIKWYQSRGSYFDRMTQCQQFLLQGDPAVKYYSPTKPDYQTGNDLLSIYSYSGVQVSASSDSFAIKFIVKNYGKTIRDTLLVSVKRTYPNGWVTLLDSVIYGTTYLTDTLYFKIRKENIDASGLNRFELFVDHINEYDEYNENNNIGIIDYYMPSRALLALYPVNYSISSNKTVTLTAQSNDRFLTSGSYYFEIDTSATFNSPMFENATLSGGSLITWNAPQKINNFSFTAPNDTVVFYWRVRYADVPPGLDTVWANSSFTYIQDSPEGWSQSTWKQFEFAQLANLDKIDSTETWQFSKVQARISILSPGGRVFYDPAVRHKMNILKTSGFFQPLTCIGAQGTLHISLLNPFDLNVISNLNTNYPLTKCNDWGSSATYMANYLQSQAGQDSLEKFLDVVPNDVYLLIMSQDSIPFQTFSATLKQKFKQRLGSVLIDSLNGGYPFSLVSYVNTTGTLIDEATANLADTVFTPQYQDAFVNADLTAKILPSGTMISTTIGPATSWGKLFFDFHSLETASADTFRINVYGTDFQNNVLQLYNNVPQDSFDLSWINADTYPLLKLEAVKKDPVNFSPPQIDKWQVIYSPAPEGIIDVAYYGNDQYQNKSVQEGEDIKFNFAFRNISKYDFSKPLIVTYSFSNGSSRGSFQDSDTLTTLKSDSILLFSKTFKTRGFAGNNSVTVFVNPFIQAEQYFANNTLQFYLEVEKDRTNPVLDVAFDGVRIMDGDIVSPTPLISIKVKDENKYIFKEDMSGFTMFTKAPDSTDYKEIMVQNNQRIKFVPGTKENGNEATIEYSPEKLSDGVHALRVQATDASGNKSANLDFEISYTVINQSGISNFYPYPNPFSTRCQFVFTLTGEELPEDMKIQIMTVTGKVVREITKQEIGPIKVGHNRTNFAWDGTDEYGDKLGNGVYLYKVVLKDRDPDMIHIKTKGDQSFAKGWGKLYILR